jgi:4-hydroxybenzoate polyprenyltransferase
VTVLRGYAQLMRLPAMFTVCSNVIAAYCVAVAYWAAADSDICAILTLPFLLTLLASLCLYHAGMVLNDCFDLEIDRQERPQRPLPAGAVGITAAWYLGWGLLGAGLILASLVTIQTLIIAAALALAILAYNSGPRRGWFAAINMGLCRYLNWIMAISAVGLDWKLALLPIPVFFYIAALTRISQEEADAADRSVLVIAAAALAAGVLCWMLWYLIGLFSDIVGAVALVLAFAFLIWRFVLLYREFNTESVQAMVGALVFGIIPLDALFLASTGQSLAALLLLVLLLPGRWLGRFLYVS